MTDPADGVAVDVGEEAVATGVCAHLSHQDAVFSTHRGHGHALAKGVTPAAVMAELFGRVTGCSQGRGGSMHLFAPEVGMMGTSGIVGPCILQAAGAGYSFKLLGLDHVGVINGPAGWLNPAAFAAAAPFTVGNAPRTLDLLGPSIKNWDFAVDKSVSVGGHASGMIRFELINAFNITGLRSPDISFGRVTFGRIVAQAGFTRVLQLTFRLGW
jgi:hypothetical protein